MKILLLWIPFVFVAIANGALREFTYGKAVSELHAHQISCFTGIALFWGLSLFLFSLFPLKSKREALIAGLIWLALTVAFEFTFGRYVAGHTWDRLLADYDLTAGRLWPLVLASVFVAPLISYIWIQRRSPVNPQTSDTKTPQSAAPAKRNPPAP